MDEVPKYEQWEPEVVCLNDRKSLSIVVEMFSKLMC